MKALDGFCGLVRNSGGKLVRSQGILDWYFDPLPTNCVASWICPEGMIKEGETAETSRRGIGYNLAVFYKACSFDCLFCQNWHFKTHFKNLWENKGKRIIFPAELASKAKEKNVRCICYFGGDQ
jgi:pyruvate formate lyase activating enzyme